MEMLTKIKYLKRICLLYNRRNVIRHLSRVTATTSALLNLIIIPDTMPCILSDVISVPNEISDHKATCLYIQSEESNSKTFKRKIWLYNKDNFDAFNADMNNFDWLCFI